MSADAVVDLDEYGFPVSECYRRLGADGSRSGVFVRFEPGFGLNVHIGFRNFLPFSKEWVDVEGVVLGIDGWRTLCALAEEWRQREATS